MPLKPLVLKAPNARQKEVMKLTNKYVAFGGSRGGGKSWLVRYLAIVYCAKYPGIKCLIVRKTYPELTENHILPLVQQLNCYGAKDERYATYNDSKKYIVFPNGSRILFRYLDTDKDAERFQGTETDILFIDEATQQPEERYKKLTACVRGVNDFPKRVYITCNPGGIGHQYVKRLFIDRRYEGLEKPEEYAFVQSRVTDNKALMASNPDYVLQLEALPPKLRKMWLEGCWDIPDGAFFEDFRTTPDVYKCEEAGISTEEALAQHKWTHVIPPFEPDRTWNIYRSYDFGYAKPFSVGWWACSPDGTLFRIMELYGCTDTPNEGVKWSPDEQFKKIKELETTHPWLKGRNIQGVADPAIWNASYGESIAETASKYGVYFVPGDNDRISGWMQFHYRLQFDSNGYSRFYVFENCKAFIRTIPLMMYSETHVEDLDTTLEDHCLVGSTQVLTDEGYKSIESLVGTEGYAMSHDGKYHKYHDVRLTRKNADIIFIELEDGTKIYCTDDHRFMLPNGEWICARDLSAGAEVKTYGSINRQQHSAEV